MTENNPQKPVAQQPKAKADPKTKSNGPSKVPMIICLVAIILLGLLIVFMLFQNSSIKKERNQILAAYNETQQVINQCQDTNTAICLYGKTTAVDDYLSIIASTLQVKPSTSYDIMIEVVPTKLAPKDAAINTDCRPNNHYLYVCQRMTSSTPKKLIESMLVSYDNLNPNIEYNVAVILTPRAVLVADDSNPQDSQMVPTNNQAVVAQPQMQEEPIQQAPEQAAQQAPEQAAQAVEAQPQAQTVAQATPDQVATNN
jgi:hypothetical protein